MAASSEPGKALHARLHSQRSTVGIIGVDSDPHVPFLPAIRQHRFDLPSIATTPESIASYDAVVVATDQHAFDDAKIAEHGRLVVHSHRRYRESNAKLVRA